MFLRRNSILVTVIAVAAVVLTVPAPTASAATVRAGGACPVVNKVSGSFGCVKVAGKKVWQKRLTQQIADRTPTSHRREAGALALVASASSGLPVVATSLTPQVCRVEAGLITAQTDGVCSLRLTQPGDVRYLAATARRVDIVIAAPAAPVVTIDPVPTTNLSVGRVSLRIRATTSVSVRSASETVCLVDGAAVVLVGSGTCIVAVTPVGANEVRISFTVVDDVTPKTPTTPTTPTKPTTPTTPVTPAPKGPSRSGVDRPDLVSGFQIKPVYVVAADGVDRELDTNGYLAATLDEGNAFLSAQIGRRLPVDRVTDGYDIAMFRSSLTNAELQTSGELSSALLKEFKALDVPGLNRKNYVFFIDVDIMRNGAACGYAPMGGMASTVAVGEECTGPANEIKNYASLTWVHEVFHNFGVEHTINDVCDFMRGEGNCTGKSWTIDANRSRYAGSAVQGVDVLKLRVWEGSTSDTTLDASCLIQSSIGVTRPEGKYALCATGTQKIGALQYCWNNVNSAALEERIGGVWKVVGAGTMEERPWGADLWSCRSGWSAPSRKVTVNQAGERQYRWMVNGKSVEEFTIFWQR